MNEQNQFDWVDFYKEFASKLLDYKDRRDELVEKVKAIYTMTGMNMLLWKRIIISLTLTLLLCLASSTRN